MRLTSTVKCGGREQRQKDKKTKKLQKHKKTKGQKDKKKGRVSEKDRKEEREKNNWQYNCMRLTLTVNFGGREESWRTLS